MWAHWLLTQHWLKETSNPPFERNPTKKRSVCTSYKPCSTRNPNPPNLPVLGCSLGLKHLECTMWIWLEFTTTAMHVQPFKNIKNSWLELLISQIWVQDAPSFLKGRLWYRASMSETYPMCLEGHDLCRTPKVPNFEQISHPSHSNIQQMSSEAQVHKCRPDRSLETTLQKPFCWARVKLKKIAWRQQINIKTSKIPENDTNRCF